MNIFYLDSDPDEAARFHNDRHVVKMLTEYTQILCTVRHLYGQEAPYKPTHQKHPSVLWAAESLSHWVWLHKLALAVYREYSYRYGKLHKAGEVVKDLLPPVMPDHGFREPPQAMPDEHKRKTAIEGYRAFYRGPKAHFSTWKKRPVPDWFNQHNQGVA